MRTIADYLVAGMGLPALDCAPTEVERGTTCAITGIEIDRGYPIWDIIPASSGDLLGLAQIGASEYLSESAARAIKGTWNMGAWMIFEDGCGYHPLIAREAARKQERPCWSDLVRQVWPARRGQSVLIILTTDAKKRVWHKARIGALGNSTPVMIYDVADMGLAAVFDIDWRVLLETLDIVENVYSMGFSKNGIRCSLLREWSQAQKIGIPQTIDLDNQIKPLRDKAEFAMATLISQKKDVKNESQAQQQKLI